MNQPLFYSFPNIQGVLHFHDDSRHSVPVQLEEVKVYLTQARILVFVSVCLCFCFVNICMDSYCFICVFRCVCVFVHAWECLQNELNWAKNSQKTCFLNPSKLDTVVKSILWSLIHADASLFFAKRKCTTVLGTYLYSRLIAPIVGNLSVTCCHHMLPIWIWEAEENSDDVPKVNISRRS